MARRKISNEWWAVLEPLIPAFTPSPKGGRRRTVDDRAALNGIVYVLHTGIAWEDLPQELGLGSGMTCWRRLRDWQAAGVWSRLHLAMLCRLPEHDQIDWERASLDAASVASPRGGHRKPAPTRRTGANSGANGIWSPGHSYRLALLGRGRYLFALRGRLVLATLSLLVRLRQAANYNIDKAGELWKR
ncbi:transposase [Mycetohabitans endofungorum]|uniref:Transposase n=1 Tax=Mycetohabitans endofungorum TaxID=417203 RepID=A0A2P5KBA9_9BURK|nr:transposase [Mycetohabitans endofungorum]